MERQFLPGRGFYLDPRQLAASIVEGKNIIPDVYFWNCHVVASAGQFGHDGELARLSNVVASSHRGEYSL
jgi:hypothetical protein